MNDHYRRLSTSAQVDTAIKAMARHIVSDFGDHSPLFVALLRGAAPFASKLLFAIAQQAPEFHPELDYMMISTYGSGQQAGEPRIVTDLAPSTTVTGRTVIVLDDVLDKGITADFSFKHLASRGARDIRLAVLAQKTVEREKPIEADYSGFTFADNWLVGMGMDDAGAAREGYRWLDEIWEIKK